MKIQTVATENEIVHNVIDDNGTVLASFDSSAAAWSWIDRHPNDPLWRRRRNSGKPMPQRR